MARRMETEAQQLAARIVAQARLEVERATERPAEPAREAAMLTVQIAEDILRRDCVMKTNRPLSDAISRA